RRWHFEHGRFYAVYRSRSVEETATGRLFDVPAHLYRQMAVDAMKWLECIVSLKTSEAFAYENRLRFFAGFFSKRLRQYLDTSGAGGRGTSGGSPAFLLWNRGCGVFNAIDIGPKICTISPRILVRTTGKKVVVPKPPAVVVNE